MSFMDTQSTSHPTEGVLSYWVGYKYMVIQYSAIAKTECYKLSTQTKDHSILGRDGQTIWREKESQCQWIVKEVQQTIFGSSASRKPSNTITSTSIFAINVLNYMKEFRTISSTITRKNTNEPVRNQTTLTTNL